MTVCFPKELKTKKNLNLDRNRRNPSRFMRNHFLISIFLLSASFLSLPLAGFSLTHDPLVASNSAFEEDKNKEITANHPAFTHTNTSSTVFFIENLKQWESHIQFRADLGHGGRLYLEKSGFTYAFCDVGDFHDRLMFNPDPENQEVVLDCHSFKMNFLGANPNPQMQPEERQVHYNNYFIGNNPDKWAGNVGLYQKVRYENLYPGIDLQLYGGEMSVKYDLILAPGTDPDQIEFGYEGLSEIMVIEGELHLVTSINRLVDSKPIAWQLENGEKIPVNCNYRLLGDKLGFDFPDGYRPDLPLIIDPTLIFSTFSGSTADNFGFTATYDTAGFLYMGGIAFGNGYPTTTGAYNEFFNGGGTGGGFSAIDVSITKFNKTGTGLVYSTYLGGSENETPHSMITTEDGRLVIYGRTFSTNFPTSNTAYDRTHNGACDIYVTILNQAGSGIYASTLIGGTGEDGLNMTTAYMQSSVKYNYGDDARGEVMLDDLNNVYIASCTKSNNFPIQGATFQTVYGGGTQDGVVFKMNPDLSTLMWSSFLGGNSNDAAYSVKVNDNYQVYVCGGTASADFPASPAGVYQSANAGGIDGFIVRLNNNGGGGIATFVGTPAYDQTYFLELDAFGDVFVVGQTTGPYPVSPGVYSEPGGTQFIHKFGPNLNVSAFSTVFGTGPTINLSPTAFLVDICGYIYVAGWGGTVNFQGNVSNMTTTPDAYQPAPDATGSDLYLVVFRQGAASIEYATFMGGPASREHVDGGTSRFNKKLEVYHAVCAGCGNNDDFPTYSVGGTPWSATNNSFNCNEAAFKFAFDPQQIIAAFTPGDLTGCPAPFPVQFINASVGGEDFLWVFHDGTTDTTSNPLYVYDSAGSYLVTLYIIDSGSCNVIDSVSRIVNVFDQPVAIASGDTTVCNGGVVPLLASGGLHYEWTPSQYLSNDTVANPLAFPPTTTTYTVYVSNPGGCIDSTEITVIVDIFQAEAGNDIFFCEGTNGVQLFGSSYGGVGPYYYEWWCDTTLTPFCGIDSVNDDDPIVLPTANTTYYLQITDWNGCISLIDSVVVTVAVNPIADAGPDLWICPDSAPGVYLQGSIANANQAPGPYTIFWLPSYGLNDTTIMTPYSRPDSTTLYTLIIVSDSTGCSSYPTTVDSLATMTLEVRPLPVAYAGPDTHLCLYDTIMLNGIGTGSGPHYDFEWSPATGLSDPNISNPRASPPMTFDYILTVWSNGCPSYGDTMTIFVHTIPTVEAGFPEEICLGDSAILNPVAGGDPTATGFSFNWSPGLGLNDSTVAYPWARPDTTTLYSVTATSSWGCESPPDTVLVYLLPTPLADAGSDTIICGGDSVLLQGGYYYTTTDTVDDPARISWFWAPTGFLGDSTQLQQWVNPTLSTNYTLTMLFNTCITSDEVLINVIPDLDASANADTLNICGGDSVQLHAIGGLGNPGFLWIPSGGLSDPTSQNPWAMPLDTTVYTLVLSESGCHDTVDIQVNVIPSPIADYINSTPEGCADHAVDFLFTGSGAIGFIWDFGDGSPVSNQLHPTHVYSEAGQYQVSLTALGQSGCQGGDNHEMITVYSQPQPDFITHPGFPVQLVLPGAEVAFEDLSVGAGHWLWEFGDGQTSSEQNPVHLYQNPGIYTVYLTVVSPHGCMDGVVHGPIEVLIPGVFIPNVFSPNEDGVNEAFRPNYTGNQPFLMRIYDRWGNLLFETRNKESGWKGTNPVGAAVSEGVYYYTVNIGGKDYTGIVTLLR